jgi:cobalamin biosynthesis Mg chelatase CobN
MKRLNLRDVGALLLFLVYLSLIALGMVSCSARKSQVEISKEVKKNVVVDNSVLEKKSETNVKETTTTKVYDKNETVTEETIYQPEDPTKESFIIEKDGTKVVLNNTKKTVKKTIQKNNTQSEIKSDSEIKQKEASKDKKAIKRVDESKTYKKQKEVKKGAFPWYYIVLIIGVIVLIFWLFRKYKDKIWWF